MLWDVIYPIIPEPASGDTDDTMPATEFDQFTERLEFALNHFLTTHNGRYTAPRTQRFSRNLGTETITSPAVNMIMQVLEGFHERSLELDQNLHETAAMLQDARTLPG